MLKATLKSLFAHTSRLVMSMLAIVLGISFLAGIFTFNRMINETFDSLIAATIPDVSVSPKGTLEKGDGSVAEGQGLTPHQVEAVSHVDGVQAVYGSSWRPNTFILDRNGKVIRTAQAPNLGGNYNPGTAYLGKTAQRIVSGHAPQGPDEVAIDASSMSKGGFQLGDTISIAIAESGKHQFTVVGTINWGENPNAGATYVAFDDATMQKYFYNGAQRYDQMWVVATPGTDVKTLATRISEQVPLTGYETTDGKTLADKQGEMLHEQLGFLGTFLTVFAIIALVVGMFLIVNTFSIVVAQRSRELALLRTMGASRGQIRRSVLLEALMTGLIGSAIGILGGWGLAALMVPVVNSTGAQILSHALAPDVRTIVVCMLVGMVTTVVAAYLPARKAAKVAPVVAMGGEAMTGEAGLGKRAVVGVVMLIVGVAALVAGVFVHCIPKPLVWTGAGAGLAMIGTAIASPLCGRPFTWLMDKLYSLIFGEVGHLAASNATRNPRRTAATASALMIGVTLVTTMGILGASAQRSMHAAFEEKLHTDAIVESAGFSGWKPEVTKSMRETLGVDKVWSMTYGQAVTPDDPKNRLNLTGMDMGQFNRTMDQKVLEGRLADKPNELMVDKVLADKQNIHAGDMISAVIAQTPVQLQVVGIIESPRGMSLGRIITPRATLINAGMPDIDYLAFIEFTPGADKQTVLDALGKATSDYPMVTVTTKMDFAKSQMAQLDQMLTLIYALLAIAVIIAVFGVVNTLVLSIMERRREIGLLRSVGMTRHQLRLMVGLESVVIALLGAVIGLGLGLVFGIALAHGLSSQGLNLIKIPWGQIGFSLVAAIVVGILASLLPAWRASRMNVLAAISTD